MTKTTTYDAAACRTKVMPPINIWKWIEEHRDRLKPPVGNQYIYDGDGFFLTCVLPRLYACARESSSSQRA